MPENEAMSSDDKRGHISSDLNLYFEFGVGGVGTPDSRGVDGPALQPPTTRARSYGACKY